MRFLVKLYPKNLAPEIKVSKIKSKKVITDDSPEGISEFQCRQQIVRGMLQKGFFVKRLTPQEETA